MCLACPYGAGDKDFVTSSARAAQPGYRLSCDSNLQVFSSFALPIRQTLAHLHGLTLQLVQRRESPFVAYCAPNGDRSFKHRFACSLPARLPRDDGDEWSGDARTGEFATASGGTEFEFHMEWWRWRRSTWSLSFIMGIIMVELQIERSHMGNEMKQMQSDP